MRFSQISNTRQGNYHTSLALLGKLIEEFHRSGSIPLDEHRSNGSVAMERVKQQVNPHDLLLRSRTSRPLRQELFDRSSIPDIEKPALIPILFPPCLPGKLIATRSTVKTFHTSLQTLTIRVPFLLMPTLEASKLPGFVDSRSLTPGTG